MKIKIKWIVIVLILFLMIVITVLLNLRSEKQTASFNNLDQQMQFLISNLVQNDTSVNSCVLSVRKGDDSFSWSGAAGISNQDTQSLMRKDTPIYIASITKLYTATVVMQLYEKGLLSLGDPMVKYLPEKLIRGIHIYRGKDYTDKITIGQLLSHTSGIADYYEEKAEDGKSLYETFLEDPKRKWTVDETIERVKNNLKPNFPPGTKASYSDTNYQLLGKIIETITGKPLNVVYDELIFRPLGLTNTYLAVYSKPKSTQINVPADVFDNKRNITIIRSNGSYWADGGIVSTTEEMLFFLKALKEERIVSEDTLKLMHNWHKLQFPLQYGYGIMYFKLPALMGIPPLWGHSGSTGSFIYYSEDYDLYFAGTINQTNSKIKPFQLIGSVIKAIQAE